jgi:dTDP-4-amino-4,6-dideoxygalactose transaminase
MIWRCDLSRQYADYKHEILDAVSRVLNSGVYTLGPELRKFEEEFASYIGVSHCVGVANATDGLTLSLMALGIGPGDEVITTPFTAIPTVSAIIDSGARPVFVDIEADTYLLDLERALAAVTPRTRAVMPVHIFGNVFDVRALREKLPAEVAVIEDAAQAHGASIGGIKAGAMGDIAVFSFYPTKNLGGYGDGGAIVTSDSTIAEKLRKLRMFGMIDKDHIDSPGINSRLDELQAAILRVKLRHLDQMNDQRRIIAGRYKSSLPAVHIKFSRVPTTVVCNYHVFVAEVPGKRDSLISYLAERGIQTNIYYPLPLSRQKALVYLGYKDGAFPVAEDLCRRVIALPMYPELPESELKCVIEGINQFFGTASLGSGESGIGRTAVTVAIP